MNLEEQPCKGPGAVTDLTGTGLIIGMTPCFKPFYEVRILNIHFLIPFPVPDIVFH